MKTTGFFLLLLLSVQIAFGQPPGRPEGAPNGLPQPRTTRDINEQDFAKRREALERLKTMKRERTVESVKPLTKEEKKKFETVTRPAEEDLAKYKDFLKQSDTGIFRLLPDYDCESENLVRLDGNCANFVSNAWAYSFRSEYYSNRNLHDISFKKDSLVSNGFFSQGLMVSLGDLPIENLSLASAGVKYLFDFKPGSEFAAVRTQYEQIKKGFDDVNYNYSNKSKVEENTTYAMRVIAYKYEEKNQREFNYNSKSPFLYLDFDKRRDVIVVFRIVRISKDSGLTIVWKKLQSIKSPTIVFKKGEQPINFTTFDN